MKLLKTSFAAWSCIAALLFFAILYNILPYDTMRDISISVAFGVTIAVTCRYAVDGFRAFRNGRLGAEFLIVAVFSTYAILSIYRGWTWFQQANTLPDGSQPQWLVNHAMNIFITWMVAWAGVMALIAPEIGETRMVTRVSVWRSVALFIGGAIVGAVLTASFRAPPQPATVVGLHAVCGEDSNVWGSSRGIYHDRESPYRSMVRATHCFDTVIQAEAAGFRPPKTTTNTHVHDTALRAPDSD